jgi:alpha-maltose-1-phosphate synthase
MRILTVTHFFESHGGGIERVAGQLSRQFAKLGAKTLWAAADCDPPPQGDVQAVPLACQNPIEKLTGLPMPLPGLRALGALWRNVRQSDAVLVHDALYATSIIALVFAKLTGTRVVLVQHIAGIAFSSPILRAVMKLANLLVTKPMLWATDELVFISDTVRGDLLGSTPWRNSTLLFNGVDRTIFYVDRDERPASSTRQILFAGRYVEKKGLAVLRALATARPDLKFLMAGSGPINSSAWGLPNVRDLGPKSQLELAELYRSSDLLFLPSVGEGYPLVIQEAMACGLPVLCGEPTNRADPDASEWIRAVRVDLADPDGTARRCGQAIDQYRRSAIDRAAMAQYAKRYDWNLMARAILELAEPKPLTALA